MTGFLCEDFYQKHILLVKKKKIKKKLPLGAVHPEIKNEKDSVTGKFKSCYEMLQR